MLFLKRKTALVCGVSMEPILHDGDIVFYKDVSNKTSIKLGDIIIFAHPTKKIILIKRVTGLNETGIEVSGDNRQYSNDSNFFGLINKSSIIGLLTSHISIKQFSKFKNFFN